MYRWQHKGKKKKQSDKEDLYALIGLANERWTANDNQIKLGGLQCTLALSMQPSMLHVLQLQCFHSCNSCYCASTTWQLFHQCA